MRIIEVLAIAVVVSAVAVALMPKLRARVVAAARSLGDSLRVATESPSRALLLFGSNLASLLITAVSMACMVRAIHPGRPTPTLVVVTAAAALFASLIPVPGNVGVGEAAITAGLVAVGDPERAGLRHRGDPADGDVVPAVGLRGLRGPLAAPCGLHQLTPALFADVPGRTVDALERPRVSRRDIPSRAGVKSGVTAHP